MNYKQSCLYVLAAVSLFSLAGCVVGPNYKRPDVPVPPRFKETGSSTAPETKTPAVGYSDWWRVFNDPALDGLETQVASANLDIRAAVARFDQAEAGTKYARSFLFPTIGAGASVSRTREAQDRPNNGNTNGLAATYTDIPVALTLGYEVDVWGKIRRSLESARALQQASADDLRFVKLSMEASTAIDYYSLRENDAEEQVLQLTIQQLQQALDLTSNRLGEACPATSKWRRRGPCSIRRRRRRKRWMSSARNWNTQLQCWLAVPLRNSPSRNRPSMAHRQRFHRDSQPTCWRRGQILPKQSATWLPPPQKSESRKRRTSRRSRSPVSQVSRA